jgi:hypothetical protein
MRKVFPPEKEGILQTFDKFVKERLIHQGYPTVGEYAILSYNEVFICNAGSPY